MYTFHDYEEAYYSGQYLECQTIGLKLLAALSDKNSKRLYKKLFKAPIDCVTDKEKKKLADILLEVRIWLGVNL